MYMKSGSVSMGCRVFDEMPERNDVLKHGRAFCFLPLPVRTGLTVQLNGYFEVSSNRWSIWYGADMDRGGKLRNRIYRDQGVAEKLVEQAMKEAAMMKDMTHSTLTRVPIGKRALYHDDIAAIVVFTEHKLIREPKSVPEISVCVRMEDDRISDLPPELHKHILSLLSTKQVLQTCVLSKTWKDVWRTTLTSIILDQRDFEDLSKLEEFGNSLLDSMPYDFNIQRFRVSCWDSSPPIPSSSVEDYDDRFLFLNMWILVVIHGTVQHIDLQVNNVPRGFKLNGHIFSSQHLKVLELSLNTYINFTCPISLPLLQSLHLGRIQFYEEDKIESLFSSCPILHSLSLIDCQFNSLKLLRISARHLRNLTIVRPIYEVTTMISTPELMSLKFHSWDKLQMGRISFKDALVLLVEADICLRDSSEVSIWFLKLVQNVRCLTLSFHFLESFKGEETNRVQYMHHPLQNLRILVLETSYSDTHVALVKTLVTHSKVESLVLKNSKCMAPPLRSSSPKEQYEKDKWSESRLPHLRLVRIEGCEGLEQEMEIMEFLLEHAPDLQKLILMSNTAITLEKLLETKEDLENCPHASETVEVLVV